MNIAKKTEKEIYLVEKMIKLYCRKNHKSKDICKECAQLTNYATERIKNCPHMATKSFCSKCKTHCYNSDMREKIRIVMRYSGPRIILYHPLIALKHILYSFF